MQGERDVVQIWEAVSLSPISHQGIKVNGVQFAQHFGLTRRSFKFRCQKGWE